MNTTEIEVPTILVDKQRCRRNIDRILSKAKKSGVTLRPHFKTHQSRLIGNWFKEAGINLITCSSVSMAEYFADDGWKDILIAFPFNVRELSRIKKLCEKTLLSISIPSAESAKILAAVCDFNIDVVIKVDTGYGRSGTLWNDKSELQSITEILDSNNLINLKGIISHAGESYKAESRDMITEIYSRSAKRMSHTLLSIGKPDLTISVGDTPTASILDTYYGVDEIRAGNFIFYDLMQYSLAVCSLDDIAIVVACPIVDIDRKNKKAVIYGGAVHFSKEYIALDGQKVFGILAEAGAETWTIPDARLYLSGLSQEHGIITLPEDADFNYKIGDLVYILPVHSCLTADAIGSYLSTDNIHLDHFAL